MVIVIVIVVVSVGVVLLLLLGVVLGVAIEAIGRTRSVVRVERLCPCPGPGLSKTKNAIWPDGFA